MSRRRSTKSSITKSSITKSSITKSLHSTAAILAAAWLMGGEPFAWTLTASAADSATTSGRVHTFNISRQALSSALVQYTKITGIDVVFDGALAQTLTSPGVSGSLTAAEALKVLLTNTGLNYRFTTANTVTLEKAAAPAAAQEPNRVSAPEPQPEPTILLPQVTVQETRDQGYVATRSAVGTKTDTPIIETPQTITIVTADQIETFKAQTVERALAYSPGVVPNPGVSNLHDMFISRGFGAEASTGSVSRDGLKISSNSWAVGKLEPYGLERIELLKGPASVLYGAVAPGGLLNIVTKRPLTEMRNEINLEPGSFSQKQASTDLGGALTGDGVWSWRLTGLLRDSDTFIQHIPNDARYAAPALKWQPSATTSLTLLTHYQNTHSARQTELPIIGTLESSVHGKIPRRRFTGEPGFDKQDMQQVAAGYLFEHAFSDSTRLRQNLRYITSDNKVLYSVLGDVDPTDPNPDDPRLYTRFAYDAFESVRGVSTDLSLEQLWQTGPIKHTLLAGLDYNHFSLVSKYRERTLPSIDVYRPVYGARAGFGTEWSEYKLASDRIGLYFQDQMKIYDRWVLLMGGRQDWAPDHSTLQGSWGVEPRSKERSHAFTGRVGGVYLAANGLAPFISFSQSFEPQSGVDRLNRRFDPTEGEQYETGLRYQPPGAKWLFSASVYRHTQTNVLTPDLADPNYSVQTGEVRSHGVEIEAKGEIYDYLNMIAAYAYTDARTTRSEDPLQVGRRTERVPYHQASLWGDYRFTDWSLPMLRIGLGTRYVGRTVSSLPGKTPSYIVMDALADIEHRGWRCALNIDNLADKTYATVSHTGHAFYGEPRRIRFSLSYRW